MKSSIYIFLATIFSYFALTEAAVCHVCGYVYGVPDELIDDSFQPFLDDSCEVGKTPHYKFMQTCPGPFDNGTQFLGCARASFRGTLPEIGIPEKVELVVRGCFPWGDETLCEDYTKSKLISIPGLPDNVVDALEALPDNFTAMVCYSIDLNDAGSFVKINLGLLFLPILCIVSKLL